MNGDSGKILNCCVKANKTLCLNSIREALDYKSREFTGHIRRVHRYPRKYPKGVPQ